MGILCSQLSNKLVQILPHDLCTAVVLPLRSSTQHRRKWVFLSEFFTDFRQLCCYFYIAHFCFVFLQHHSLSSLTFVLENFESWPCFFVSNSVVSNRFTPLVIWLLVRLALDQLFLSLVIRSSSGWSEIYCVVSMPELRSSSIFKRTLSSMCTALGVEQFLNW